jgi:DNA-nicking Smr family endonuclease
MGRKMLKLAQHLDIFLPQAMTKEGTMSTPDQEPVEYPLDGILDLHHFSPKEVKGLVSEYIRACLDKGITSIRIIHGKGTGTLRRVVHSVLDKESNVISYRLDGSSASSWGATLVELRNPAAGDQSKA